MTRLVSVRITSSESEEADAEGLGFDSTALFLIGSHLSRSRLEPKSFSFGRFFGGDWAKEDSETSVKATLTIETHSKQTLSRMGSRKGFYLVGWCVVIVTTNDVVLRMVLYAKFDLSLHAIVRFVSRVVTDDVSMIDINQDSIVNAVGLFRLFKKLGPTSRS